MVDARELNGMHIRHRLALPPAAGELLKIYLSSILAYFIIEQKR
jgi:hypothetical protein